MTDEPTLTIAAQGTGYLAVTVSRRHTTEWTVNERKVAVVAGGSELVIEAPQEGEIVTIAAEQVTDHA